MVGDGFGRADSFGGTAVGGGRRVGRREPRPGGSAGAGGVHLAVTAPVIEVFADIWCPFAHVGLRRLRTLREHAEMPEFLVHVRAWPLELVNGRPLDPVTTAHHVAELRAQVAPECFAHFDPDRFPTTTLPRPGAGPRRLPP